MKEEWQAGIWKAFIEQGGFHKYMGHPYWTEIRCLCFYGWELFGELHITTA